MHKWALATALGLWIGLCSVSLEAQNRSDNIGVLLAGGPSNNVRNLDALRDGLRNYGWTEGNNVNITPVYAMGDYSRLPALAKELVDQKVRIILAGNERSLIASKDTGADIPIVVVACDPLEKLLGSLARPGGNATGISCVSADLIGKRFDHLRAIVPNLKRVALLFNPQDISDIELREAAKASNLLSIEIVQFPVTTADELNPAFEKMASSNCEAVYVSLSAFTNFHAKKLSELALQKKLPLISSGPEFPEAGGLISYGSPLSEGFRRSAYFIDRILKGTSPKDLPAEEPTKFYMVINAKTAATLGLKIPDVIQVQADRIID
ncbi:MAG: ABC transporter substrate-binding protein [Pseudolabrys sp.]|jgi:putative ABC transport system substrate-binding protein